MEYKAWIREITPLVFDNSKTIYQIISEIIPILVEDRDNQNSFATTMDTNKTTIETAIKEIETANETFKTSLFNTMDTYQENYNTNVETLKSDIETLTSNFTTQLTSLITNYNNQFTQDTTEINTIIANKDGDLLVYITDMLGVYYSALQEVVPDYFESASFNSDIYTTLKASLDTVYKNNQVELWIELDDMSETAGSDTPSEIGRYVYNTTTNILYTSENTTTLHWREENILLNGLYKFNNKLYQGSLISIMGSDIYPTPTNVTSVMGGISETEIIYYYQYDKTIRQYIKNDNWSVNTYEIVVVDDYVPFINNPVRALCGACKFNDIYYAFFRSSTGSGQYLLQSTDLTNWNYVEYFNITNFNGYAYLSVFNDILFLNYNNKEYPNGYALINDEWVSLPVTAVYGIYNDYYIGAIIDDTQVNNKYRLVQSQDVTFSNYTYMNNFYFNDIYEVYGMFPSFGSDFIVYGKKIMNSQMTEQQTQNAILETPFNINEYLVNGLYGDRLTISNIKDLIAINSQVINPNLISNGNIGIISPYKSFTRFGVKSNGTYFEINPVIQLVEL